MIGRLAATVLLSTSGLATLLAPPVHGQDTGEPHRPVEGEDFRVYDIGGQSSSFAAVLNALSDADVVLVGEEHDDVVGHRFEAELLGAAYRRLQAEDGRDVILSLEMFERDVQYILAEYLDGTISETHFLDSSRPWDGYADRYRPLVEFCKAHGLTVIAANAPRRYVSRVSIEGPESLHALSATAKSFLPPLPYPGPSMEYRAQWDALMAEAMAVLETQADSSAAQADAAEAPSPRHSTMSPNVIYSQALWDAAMGHAITSALGANPGSLVIHVAGSFHVQRGTGIPERVADYGPGTRVLSIVLVSVHDITVWNEKEHARLGDFVVLTRQTEAVIDGSGN